MTGPAYQAALDEIFRTYAAIKGRVEGLPDRAFRRPQRLVALASELGLVPPPARTIRVTGSKGKGTTSRIVATYLARATGERVGLVLSPEELEHTDRARVDGVPVEEGEFLAAWDALRPALARAERDFAGDDYWSPSGLFLLIALQCFRARGCARFVLEGGRGVRFDEVGNLESAVAVVTSVLFEHPTQLGPTLADIAADKLAVGERSPRVVLGATAAAWNGRLAAIDPARVVPPAAPGPRIPGLPAWYAADEALAAAACAAAGVAVDPEIRRIPVPTASFGRLRLGELALTYDALISAGSLDPQLVDDLRAAAGGRLAVVLSLPDDKDSAPVIEWFTARGLPPLHVALAGTRGYLHYDELRRARADALLGVVDVGEPAALAGLLAVAAARTDATALYVAGTQTFIRTLRRAVPG